MYQKIFKPLLDRLGAGILLVLLSPLLCAVMIAIRFSLGHPIFFVQKRPGQKEKPFNIYKFRTMNEQVDARGSPLPDEQRLHGIGKLIRSLSLDELPQLFNVLRGEMSFVGPRPLLIEYLPLYSEKQKRRHDVKPGITGWAQVNGRNAISWEKKFALDVWYVDHLSFRLDQKILWMTFLKVLGGEGVSPDTAVTMEKFKGSK